MHNHYSFVKKNKSIFYTIMVLLYMAYSSNIGCTEQMKPPITKQIGTINSKKDLPNLQKKSSSTQSLVNKNSTEEISELPLPDLVSELDTNKRKCTNSDEKTDENPPKNVKKPSENEQYPLHEAILKKDYKTVKNLLKNKAEPNQKDKNGDTPLHVAVNAVNKENSPNIVKLLLDKKADPLLENNLKQTSLDWAVIYDHLDIFIQLIQIIKKTSNQDETGLNKILNKINKKIDDEENTLLHYIVRKKNYKTNEIAKWLLEKGADPNIQNKRGYVPLHYVINDDNFLLYDLLLQHNAHLDIKNELEQAPLDLLDLKNQHDKILDLINAGLSQSSE